MGRPLHSSSYLPVMLLALLAVTSSNLLMVRAGSFHSEVDITWGDGRGKILNGGELITMSLDKTSGSGFQSKHEYLFGKIDVKIKLVSGNSAGTVTTYYLKSPGRNWDEIDFEFLGNLSGDPYVLHTNVYIQGKGNREQQFYLWFDHTKNFHTHSILWTSKHIIFSVDGTPIREYKNMESMGLPFSGKQPTRLYSTLWNADDWATRGGLVKMDWSHAPVTVSYRNFNVNACVWTSGKSSCPANSVASISSWMNGLDGSEQDEMG